MASSQHQQQQAQQSPESRFPLLCCACRRGSLFELAYTAAKRGERVTYVCPKPTAREARAFFAEGRRDASVLQQIKMRYLPSCTALQCYMTCAQLLAEPPGVLVLDGFFEATTAVEDGGTGSVDAHAQWLNSLAAIADAVHFLRQQHGSGAFYAVLGADGAMCQGSETPSARFFARHAQRATLDTGGALVVAAH